MSDTLADLASWLPSDFLTDEDNFPLLLNNHNPHLFPYEFASSSSTESESDEDDIAGVTRRYTRSVSLQERINTPYPFEKRVFSGSPESTLNWTVSGPTKSYSSPTTPLVQADKHSWDLVYAAAGQVARMKMRMNNVGDNVFTNRESELFIRQQQFRQRVAGGGGRCGGGRPAGFRQSPWPPLPVENQRLHQLPNGVIAKPVLGGSGGRCGGGTAVVKRECAGTGVFLPRRYCNDPEEMKKKPACSPAHLPARVAPSFTKNMDPIKAQAQPTIHGGFAPHYEIAIARRNAAMLAQQRWSATLVSVVPETPMGHSEVVLPQEWTY
ncbi:unnamed protein product [Lactuca virosa]|uniref:Uncharacterized protein n=1 Tax=Lactuca virosa TaxID=75947 RepID=A0AAU9NL56_9ASTR|nr:unnamed protein product [Lactuca virosa]